MKLLTIVLWALVAAVLADEGRAPLDGFRPPSIPIITMDPFVNLWSSHDHAYDGYATTWNNVTKEIRLAIRVDGQSLLAFGYGTNLPRIPVIQTSVKVWPTRTIYELQDPLGKVNLTIEWTTPLLPRQWEISSRTVTYVTFTAASMDGHNHNVELFFEAFSELVVNDNSEYITWGRYPVSAATAEATVMRIGTEAQNYMGIRNYTSYIDWGYAQVALLKDSTEGSSIYSYYMPCSDFTSAGTIPNDIDDDRGPMPAGSVYMAWNVGWQFPVDKLTPVSKHLVFAYDDYYSVNYFGQQLHPYWRRPEAEPSTEKMMKSAIDDYHTLMEACREFDHQLVQELEAKGGAKYATLASLAYRQTMAATKIVWNQELQKPWAFLRSISKQQDMSTVDAIAAAAPLLLYQDPELLQLLLLPILAYANNETDNATYNYPYPWAPHHLGTYPVADVTPGDQNNMPMEETGNVFILLAALVKTLGESSTDQWYPQYWPLLQSWADYLIATLPDPGDQKSPDDYDAPTPHNTNLAVKGIVGLGAFSRLCDLFGKYNESSYYYQQAASFAAQWAQMAHQGDHYKMAFNESNSWSLKYNFFYERLLGLGLFSKDVVTQELAYYRTYHTNTYGIPLDGTVTYTKLEWMALVTALSDDAAQKEELLGILYNWADNTTPRTPLTDWYDTLTGIQQGHTASPVVGALYGLMLL